MRRNARTPALLLAVVACGAEADGSPAPQGLALAELEARRVWSGSQFNFYVEAPSPDGRLLTDVDWETGDLAVRDLASGELRRVTDKGPWRTSDDYAGESVFSPDGSRIAFNWFRGALGRPQGTVSGYELRSVGLDGSDLRVHFPVREDVRYVVAEDWSRDGTTVLVTVSRKDRTSQIGLVDLATNAYSILKSTDWRTPLTAAFSHDGRWVVYDFPPEPEALTRDIYALAVDGSREVPVVQSPAHERFMGWLPDGGGILFHRDSDREKAFYVQRMSDGAPVGAPELLKEDVWSIDPFGFSREAFFYGVHVERLQVNVASVDLEAGRALSAPEPVASPSAPSSRFSAWSPDGQSLAFLRPSHGGSAPEVVVRSLSGEVVRRLPLPLAGALTLHWTTAGLVTGGNGLDGKTALWLVTLETGELEPLFELEEGDVGRVFGAAVSPDASEVYFRRQGPAAPGSVQTLEDWRGELVARNVSTGAERVLTEVGRGRRMAVSPDGLLLAYSGIGVDGRRGLWVVPTAGGTPRLIHAIDSTRDWLGQQGTLPFTPDGRHVLWTEWDADQDPGVLERTIYLVPVDGGGAKPLMDIQLQGMNLSVSPDGRRIAFEGGRERGEIWRLSGFEVAARGAGEPGPSHR